MTISRSIIIMAVLASMLAIAGCAGGDADGPQHFQGPPMDTGAGLSNDPPPLFLEPGDEGEGEGDDPDLDPGAGSTGTTTENPPTGQTQKISCPSWNFPAGEVGTTYSVPFKAKGGTGELSYATKTSKPLPEGLALSPDGLISGTPTTVEETTSTVVVTDDTNKTKNCTVKIKVNGKVGIGINVLKGIRDTWTAVYEVTVFGTWNGALAWTWTGIDDNICMSDEKPDTSNESFRTCDDSTTISSGNKAYLWLREDKKGEKPLAIGLTIANGSAIDKAKYTFTFGYTICSDGKTSADGTCDTKKEGDAKSPEPFTFSDSSPPSTVEGGTKVGSITVTLMTGNAGDDSDTDCQVSIRFCKDKDMITCTEMIVLDDLDDKDDREEGETNSYESDSNPLIPSDFDLPEDMTSDHQYFQLSVDKYGDCGNDSNNWLLQGVRVDIQYVSFYNQSLSSTYYNPCVEQWMDKGDTLNFGPNDTAVCAIVTTGDVSHGGTNDSVFLALENFDATKTNSGTTDTSLSEWSSHFEGTTDIAKVDLFWGGADDIDDFKRGTAISYGDYLFDVKPYNGAPTIHFEKLSDGTDGGWCLEKYQVFVFQPGKFLNTPETSADATVWHLGKVQSTPEDSCWLDDDGLATDSATLIKGNSSLITDAIGQHW